MRIAILAARAGYIRRGVESLAFELVNHLPFDTTVFSLAASDWTVQVKGVTRDMPVHRLYTLISKALKLNIWDELIPRIHILNHYSIEELTYGWNLREAFDSLRPDVILNLSGPIVGRFCMAYRKHSGTPFIVAGEAGIGLTERKNAYTKPDKYIAINPEAVRFIKKIDSKLDVELVPNGVNVDLFTPSGPKLSANELRRLSGNLGLTVEHPIVISTSALEKGKRLNLAIQVMERLAAGTLILAGDGTKRAELVALGQELLGSRFGYVGSLPYTDLPSLYRTGDVFCMPSANEPFGNVMIEAMASGCPIVASDDESRRWILGSQGGIVVDVTNADKFADAIRHAYLKDWGEGPRNESLRFSWSHVATRYADILERVYLGEC